MRLLHTIHNARANISERRTLEGPQVHHPLAPDWDMMISRFFVFRRVAYPHDLIEDHLIVLVTIA